MRAASEREKRLAEKAHDKTGKALTRGRKPKVVGILDQLASGEALSVDPGEIMTNDFVALCGGIYQVIGIFEDKVKIDMGGTITLLPRAGLQKVLSCEYRRRGHL